MKVLTARSALRVAALCAAMTASSAVISTAQAGWLADFLCWGDNSPAQCRSHLPSWALNANVPTYSPATSSLVMKASQLKGDEKRSFIEKNAMALGGPKSPDTPK